MGAQAVGVATYLNVGARSVPAGIRCTYFWAPEQFQTHLRNLSGVYRMLAQSSENQARGDLPLRCRPCVSP